MRALLAFALLAAALAAVPSASAAVTVPEELCEPGQGGVCHGYTADGNQCAFTHLGTMWAGACTTSDAKAPLLVCSTVQTGLWDGWCWQGGNVVQNLVAEAGRLVAELLP